MYASDIINVCVATSKCILSAPLSHSGYNAGYKIDTIAPTYEQDDLASMRDCNITLSTMTKNILRISCACFLILYSFLENAPYLSDVLYRINVNIFFHTVNLATYVYIHQIAIDCCKWLENG